MSAKTFRMIRLLLSSLKCMLTEDISPKFGTGFECSAIFNNLKSIDIMVKDFFEKIISRFWKLKPNVMNDNIKVVYVII